MQAVKVTPKRQGLMSIFLSADFHVGIKIHYCGQCGGFVGIYLTFLHIEIPIIRKIVDNLEMVELSEADKAKAHAMMKKYLEENDKPPV